ncbi:heavy metal-associated isoprenylated plant protein 43-like [Wolffia australiana]
MPVQKMDFKISIYCSKCKVAIFRAIAKLEGIDQVMIDGEKGMVTVIGEVDPVRVATQLRKVRPAIIQSVGVYKPPEKKEEKKDEKKDEKKVEKKEEKKDEKKEEKKEHHALPACCNHCNGQTIVFADPVQGCTIF